LEKYGFAATLVLHHGLLNNTYRGRHENMTPQDWNAINFFIGITALAVFLYYYLRSR
jgi:hypothetical protein